MVALTGLLVAAVAGSYLLAPALWVDRDGIERQLLADVQATFNAEGRGIVVQDVDIRRTGLDEYRGEVSGVIPKGAHLACSIAVRVEPGGKLLWKTKPCSVR